MEEDVEQAATGRLCERGPPRMKAAAGPGDRPTAGHLWIKQTEGSKVEIC